MVGLGTYVLQLTILLHSYGCLVWSYTSIIKMYLFSRQVLVISLLCIDFSFGKKPIIRNGWKVFTGRGCGTITPIRYLETMPEDTSNLSCTLVRDKPLTSKAPETKPNFELEGTVAWGNEEVLKEFQDWGLHFRVEFDLEIKEWQATITAPKKFFEYLLIAPCHSSF